MTPGYIAPLTALPTMGHETSTFLLATWRVQLLISVSTDFLISKTLTFSVKLWWVFIGSDKSKQQRGGLPWDQWAPGENDAADASLGVATHLNAC